MALEDFILSGFANRAFIEKLYAEYLINPWEIDPGWREAFQLLDAEKEKKVAVADSEKTTQQDLRPYLLIQAYRTYGHLMAKINPLAHTPLNEPWQLSIYRHGFQESDLARDFPSYGLLEKPQAPLESIISVLKEIYCSKIGVEYKGVQDPDLEQWLEQHIEPNRFQIQLSIDEKRRILQYLNKSELFESFLHTKYVGQKRFSLEGGETLIPMLAAVIQKGSELGSEKFVLGMAHRGRLNVLSNIMQKSYAQIFSEFEEGYIPLSFEGSGDVKYHKGFSSEVATANGKSVAVFLAPNPSHLEAVDPVVQGQVRALLTLKNEGPAGGSVIPVLIHGDAAIAGQGVVYETMQLYNLKGYSTGGTIHIVINNQIGFTALPQDTRSTHYCTDAARTFNAPVFHVNAEDPEACVFATNLAVEIRQKFHCDVLIDLVCYRKYGHNEADEPAFTQPIEYQIIRQKKPIREIYRDDLIQQGVLERKMAEALEEEFKEALQKELAETKFPEHAASRGKRPPPEKASRVQPFEKCQTSVSLQVLEELGKKMTSIPEGFTPHKKLEKVISDRYSMAEGKKPLDWGMGEMLAYATLLYDKLPVRISGQDCCRGTFSHRHALWMDQKEERPYYPLKHLSEGQGRFDIYNSPLSEFAVLGFEYGYSLTAPQGLVIWEAQFGDFCNGAQVIIDQFIATGEMKWAQKSCLTLFLPHGYEGQGPEHSSGRMERFLALCGDHNMFVVNPTTPAQMFHLLRRQALQKTPKPLMVFTPKGLLRHPECISDLRDLAQGTFEEVIDDPEGEKNASTVVFCSGRLYYDLLAERKERGAKDFALVRMEQLYPFHEEKVASLIRSKKNAKKIVWAQEEPENMGAWDFVRPIFHKLLPKGVSLEYVGRRRSASPAVGSFALHKKEYAEMMKSLFEG